MGTLGSRIARPLKNWNIESRVQKAISKPKPNPAPSYPSTQKQIELVNKLHPDYKEKAARKDETLNEHLKQVFVSSNSTELQDIDSRTDPNRPLPRDKNLFEGFEFGFYEPSEAKHGRLTLRQSIEMISKYHSDQKKNTPQALATEYKLSQKAAENILEFFQLYNIHDKKSNNLRDALAMPLQVSLKTSIRIPHTKKPKKRIEGGPDMVIMDDRKPPLGLLDKEEAPPRVIDDKETLERRIRDK